MPKQLSIRTSVNEYFKYEDTDVCISVTLEQYNNGYLEPNSNDEDDTYTNNVSHQTSTNYAIRSLVRFPHFSANGYTDQLYDHYVIHGTECLESLRESVNTHRKENYIEKISQSHFLFDSPTSVKA
ncbi:hypothetical protein NPIL_69661 [Nephila pilipes]|uniref:Uncharacterized protein n=1 Tax=Nephila pilipes TaxID=299642 RepID=A0A8X6IDS4_NEPPI|nr:hypothetical protein NPIL_69661 [Nephila pilipes]